MNMIQIQSVLRFSVITPKGQKSQTPSLGLDSAEVTTGKQTHTQSSMCILHSHVTVARVKMTET